MADLSERACRLLDSIEYATLATVSSAGEPWNTPVYFVRRGRSILWTSRRDAQHSTNIRDNGQGFLVVFDSTEADASGAAVYIKGHITELTDPEAIAAAIAAIYRRRGKPVAPAAAFASGSLHAVYELRVLSAWTNLLHADGNVPWDERIPIVIPEDRSRQRDTR